MGNGVMCVTTSKSMVAQGSANQPKSGAPLPPPPKGVGGGGSAAHLYAEVVAQDTYQMAPMPLFLSKGWVAAEGYASLLCRIRVGR